MNRLALKRHTIGINKFKCKKNHKYIWETLKMHAVKTWQTAAGILPLQGLLLLKSVLIHIKSAYQMSELHQFPFVCHHRNEHSRKYRLLFFHLTIKMHLSPPLNSSSGSNRMRLLLAKSTLHLCDSQIRRCSCDPRGFIQRQASIFPVWQN